MDVQNDARRTRVSKNDTIHGPRVVCTELKTGYHSLLTEQFDPPVFMLHVGRLQKAKSVFLNNKNRTKTRTICDVFRITFQQLDIVSTSRQCTESAR